MVTMSEASASFVSLGIHVIECLVLLTICGIIRWRWIKERGWTMSQLVTLSTIGVGGFIGFCLTHASYDAAQFFKLYIVVNFCGWLTLWELPAKRCRHCFVILSLVACLIGVRFFLRMRTRTEYAEQQREHFQCLRKIALRIEKARGQVVVAELDSRRSDDRLCTLYPQRGTLYPLGGYLHRAYFISLNPLVVSDKKWKRYSWMRTTPAGMARSDFRIRNELISRLDIINVAANDSLPDEIANHFKLISIDPVTGFKLYCSFADFILN